jgi:hypothetical protein
MFDFLSPLDGRLLSLSSADPVESVTVSGDDGGDLLVEVNVAGTWSFACVVHPDDTVTKPLAAADITITVTR